MRRHSKDMGCIDWIQFGQDDILPFYTLKKSRRMCGVKNGKTNSSQGFFYDDPTGNLLIWISLGGRRKTTHWNEISEVSLTLIITAYKVTCYFEVSIYLRFQNLKICTENIVKVWAVNS